MIYHLIIRFNNNYLRILMPNGELYLHKLLSVFAKFIYQYSTAIIMT